MMQQRRAAVRNLAYSSAIAIAQAAITDGAVAEVFEDSFSGGDIDWTGYAMFEGGTVQGHSVKVITASADIDAEYAGIYAGHLGEAGAAEARVDGFTYVVR